MLKRIQFSLFPRWFFDSIFHLIIALASLAVVFWAIFAALRDFSVLNTILTIFGCISLYYSGIKLVVNTVNDRHQYQLFEANTEIFFAKCRKSILKHFPKSEANIRRAQQQVLTVYFGDWKRFQQIHDFEYKLLDSYLAYFAKWEALDESDRLFLKFRLITSDFTSHFSTFVEEVREGDFLTAGTVHNRFIKKIYLLANNKRMNVNLDKLELEAVEIEETISYALKRKSPILKVLIQEKQGRQRIEYLMAKCYENGFSNIGDLDKDLAAKNKLPITLLFKYDERFKYWKLNWQKAIKEHLRQSIKSAKKLDKEYAANTKILTDMLSPQPFYKALRDDYSNSFEQVGRNNQLFIVHREGFGAEAKNWPVNKFMDRNVIPQAKVRLEELNKKIVDQFPFLVNLQKNSVNPNYYLFHLPRDGFEHFAEYESMPWAIKNLIVEKIMDSENAAEHVTAQLVYLKQVISKMSLSGLLFTEDNETQETMLSFEKEILESAKAKGLQIESMTEIASVGNKSAVLIAVIYKAYFGRNLKAKKGEKYQRAKKLSSTIISNAKELMNIFHALRTSAEEKQD